MRISDWSSDVCSSDLQPARDVGGHQFARIFVLKLVDAAFAAAVTERFPFGPRHRPERLCLPEWRGGAHFTQRSSSAAMSSGLSTCVNSSIGFPSDRKSTRLNSSH